ncbi:MAG: hypothetical protein N3G20_11795, partial [Verrucomicrobiae bacterium]|nr:hypothetical protein [Verrucomicrobiae bacterium]
MTNDPGTFVPNPSTLHLPYLYASLMICRKATFAFFWSQRSGPGANSGFNHLDRDGSNDDNWNIGTRSCT